jgi:hypothetical protein
MDAKIRAWWSHQQGLDGSLAGQTAREVLKQTGWSRSAASLIAPEDAGRELVRKGGIGDLPGHAIPDRGRLVGLWHFDPEADTIAWSSIIRKDRALEEAVARTEAFVREDLGDARTFSLDSPKSRAPRIAELRKAAAG